jgi:hypothetical protein
MLTLGLSLRGVEPPICNAQTPFFINAQNYMQDHDEPSIASASVITKIVLQLLK